MIKILKIFYKFVAEKKLRFAILLVTIVAASIAGSIVPYFFKLFIDAIPTMDYPKLVQILLLYLAVRLVGVSFDQISYFIGDMILVDSAPKTRIAVFKKIEDLDFAFHIRKSTGSLISMIKRGDGAFFSLFQTIHFRFLDIGIGFIVMIYFFTKLDPIISVVTVVSFLCILLASKFIVKLNISTRTKFNEEEDNVSSVIVDNLINFDTVKLFAKEKWELARLDKTFNGWRKALWNYGLSFRVYDITLSLIINTSIVLSLLFALKLTTNKGLSLGDFVMVTTFINIFYPRVFDLVWGFREIAKNYSDIQKYFGVFDNEIEVKDPLKPVSIDNPKGEIEFNKVTFSYKGGQKNALNNFSLKIRQGQSVALVGRSGSGKTTVVKLLMRFYDIEKGKITFDKINITDLKKETLRGLIGIVPQEPILFDNTIAYNIVYGKPSSSMREIKAAAKIANIHDFIESLPKKYETNVGERGVKLSGGQKQRLAIARMILASPPVIIFDEATSQLDSESEALIQDALWKSTKDKTVIIIAHRLSTVMRANKIVVVEKGKVIEEGSHELLLQKKNSLYSHFWNLQIKI